MAIEWPYASYLLHVKHMFHCLLSKACRITSLWNKFNVQDTLLLQKCIGQAFNSIPKGATTT